MLVGCVGGCFEMILGHTACSCVNVGQYRAIYHLEPLKLKDMTVIKEEDVISSSSVSDEDRLPTKQERLLELINSKKDGRFLVFSSYDNSFNTVRELLNKEGIPWSKLCGNTYQINKIINCVTVYYIKLLILNTLKHEYKFYKLKEYSLKKYYLINL